MPIFISHSHADKEIAEALAVNLVQAKLNVWIDHWELNAGDSLIDKIQEALGDADAILVLLSESSIQSEWCKKELNAGLIRELDERSVVVIPIVLDDCKVPLFLKEKLLVDFRKNRDDQLRFLIRSLARVSNAAQSRIESPEFHTDWSMTPVSMDESRGIEWTFIDHGEKLPYTILTQVLMWFDDEAAREFARLQTLQDQFEYSAKCMSVAFGSLDDFQVIISSSEPKRFAKKAELSAGLDGSIDISVIVRRLGVDNGMDTLVHIDDTLKRAINHTLSVTRKGS